jgi:hypothetical protein
MLAVAKLKFGCECVFDAELHSVASGVLCRVCQDGWRGSFEGTGLPCRMTPR